MSSHPRDALIGLIARFGPELAADPRRVGALLRDALGETSRREVHALVGAATLGVAGDLASGATGMPLDVRIGRGAQRIADDIGLAPELALWSVRTWAFALGLLPPSAATAADLAAPRSVISLTSSPGDDPSVRSPGVPAPAAAEVHAASAPPVGMAGAAAPARSGGSRAATWFMVAVMALGGFGAWSWTKQREAEERQRALAAKLEQERAQAKREAVARRAREDETRRRERAAAERTRLAAEEERRRNEDRIRREAEERGRREAEEKAQLLLQAEQARKENELLRARMTAQQAEAEARSLRAEQQRQNQSSLAQRHEQARQQALRNEQQRLETQRQSLARQQEQARQQAERQAQAQKQAERQEQLRRQLAEKQELARQEQQRRQAERLQTVALASTSPSGVRSPQEMCADRPNIFSRSICEHRECTNNPAHRNNPYCQRVLESQNRQQ